MCVCFSLSFVNLDLWMGWEEGRRCLIYQCTVALTLNSSADHYSPSRHAAVQPVSHKSTNSLRTRWQIFFLLDGKYDKYLEMPNIMAQVPLSNQPHTSQPTDYELNGKYDKDLGIFLKYLEYLEYDTRFIVQVNQQSAK